MDGTALEEVPDVYRECRDDGFIILLEIETLASGAARLTHDHKEGVDAFKEKRPPKFLGK